MHILFFEFYPSAIFLVWQLDRARLPAVPLNSRKPPHPTHSLPVQLSSTAAVERQCDGSLWITLGSKISWSIVLGCLQLQYFRVGLFLDIIYCKTIATHTSRDFIISQEGALQRVQTNKYGRSRFGKHTKARRPIRRCYIRLSCAETRPRPRRKHLHIRY